jgi:hypothetical protein
VEVNFDAILGTQFIEVVIPMGVATGYGEVGPIFSSSETGPNVTYSCIISCDTPSVSLVGFSC